MAPAPLIYRASAPGPSVCLRQGEILSEIVQIRLAQSANRDASPEIVAIQHPFAIILTQDCDLEQDFNARQGRASQDKLLPNLLLGEVFRADELRGTASINSTIWSGIRINKHERYHFLQRIEPSSDLLKFGLAELGLDFKRIFTIPVDEAYQQLNEGPAKRRCVLVSPYLEHLSSRFAYYLSRVALPSDHISE